VDRSQPGAHSGLRLRLPDRPQSHSDACADKEIDRTKTVPLPAMYPLSVTVQRLVTSSASTAAAQVDAEAKAKRNQMKYTSEISSYFK
jgi:hypothetical protein